MTIVNLVEAKPYGSAVDDRLYFELVRVLFSTPKSVLVASLVAMTFLVIAAFLTADVAYVLFLAGFTIIAAFRCIAIWLYRCHEPAQSDISALRRWEFVALIGAWAFSGLSGLIGAYTILVHPSTDVETMINCCVIGYIAGISSRNASRPAITIGQISAICIPFTLGLLARLDTVHVALAIFISLLYLSTIVMARSMHENIVMRYRANAELERIAHFDSLTGLLSRSAFMQRLERRLANNAGFGCPVTLIAIDLDRFKDVNDTIGHPAGDEVLKEAARRISSVIQQADSASRIGGDEFLIAISGEGQERPEAVAQRILNKLAERFTVGGTSVSCAASAGLANADQTGTTLDELLRNADLALYEAKHHGRGQLIHYSPLLSRSYQERISLEHDLQKALENHELELFYQPIVDPRNGRVVCCEALLRWNHPTRGMVSPSEFIPIAESTGMIINIGEWVLKTACKDAMSWTYNIKVAVNLSPIQFKDGRKIVETVRHALEEFGLPGNRLDLEITESVLIEDNSAAISIMEELRESDVGFSLDDFGTGFSSLAYLVDFPFSKVKIDRKFTQSIESSRAFCVVKGIAQLSRDLGIELVAEGVETMEQLDLIQKLGITAIQGYLFSKPVSVTSLHPLLMKPIGPEIVIAQAKKRAIQNSKQSAA